jgi:AcrR family transcriptional regulator
MGAMGVKERRDRERLGMQKAILDAAREVAATEGWQAVTIRRVAEKIEYSPPTIYEYFESKEALLEAEMHEAFRLMINDLTAARDAHAVPEEQFRAMFDAFWNFVWKQPEMYQVISGLGGVRFTDHDCGGDDPDHEGNQVGALWGEVLRAMLPPAEGTPEKLKGKTMTLWSLVHGFIALIMAGHFPIAEREHARGLVIQAAADLLRAWRTA